MATTATERNGIGEEGSESRSIPPRILLVFRADSTASRFVSLQRFQDSFDRVISSDPFFLAVFYLSDRSIHPWLESRHFDQEGESDLFARRVSFILPNYAHRRRYVHIASVVSRGCGATSCGTAVSEMHGGLRLSKGSIKSPNIITLVAIRREGAPNQVNIQAYAYNTKVAGNYGCIAALLMIGWLHLFDNFIVIWDPSRVVRAARCNQDMTR